MTHPLFKIVATVCTVAVSDCAKFEDKRTYLQPRHVVYFILQGGEIICIGKTPP
jgi:hypothetical protein